MIITIANTKGGTGKSTISFSLAGLFAKEFENFLMIDSDVQLSSANAYATRCENQELKQFTCISIQTPTLHREAEKFNNLYDQVIIDTGGRDSKTFRSACSAADAIIIPLKPTQLDLEATEETIMILEEIRVIKPLDIFLLLNQSITGSSLSAEILQIMVKLEEEYNVKTFETILHNRVDYARAIEFGMSPFEYNKSGKAAKEMNLLFNEIKSKILNKTALV
jgi:chromosome partitioning protein